MNGPKEMESRADGELVRLRGRVLDLEAEARRRETRGEELARARDEAMLRADQRIAELAGFPAENPNPVLRFSTDGTIQYANKPGADVLDHWNCRVGLRATEPFRKMVQEAAGSGTVTERQVRCGDRVFSFLSVRRADLGSVSLYGHDVTSRLRAEEELRKINRGLHAHTRSAHAMMRARNEAEYLQEVCRIVTENCGRAMVWIGYAEEDADKNVRPVAHSGFEQGYIEKVNVTWADTERGRGPTGTAVRTGQPCSCRNVLSDPAFEPWREEAQKRGYASSCALPLIADGKVLGAITIYAKEPDAFAEEEVALLSGLADDLAFGISSLRLREAHARAEEDVRRSRNELETRVRERTQELTEAIRRLRESQHVIQRIAETSPDFIYIYDLANLQITYANPRAAEFMGRLPEEPGSMRPSFFEKNVHPDDRPALEDSRRRFAGADESDVIEHEYRAQRADGAWRWLLVRETLFARGPDGAPRQALAAALDITDRKQAEAVLKAHNAFLGLFARMNSRRSYLDSAVELLAATSNCRAVGIRLLNERGEIPYEASIGFSEEFLKSECRLSVDRDCCVCTRVALDKSEPQDGPVRTPNGSFLCGNGSKFMGALSPSEQTRFRGVCVKMGYATLAVLPLRYGGKVIGVLHCADPAAETVGPDVIQLLESVTPLLAEGVHRFNVEETLRDSEARVRAIFDHAFQFVALLRPEGTVVEVNQPALEFAGSALSDVRDRPLWEAKWWSASPEGQKQLKAALAEAAAGHFVRYETTLQGAGEETIVADLSIKPVLDGEGQAALLVVEARDITERRRLEWEILEIAGREQERIGHELHDALGQTLVGIAMLSRTLQKKLAARSPHEAEEVSKISELAGQAATQTRQIARGLNPVEVSEDGLMEALRELTAGAEKVYGIPCEFRCDTPALVRDNNVATQLYYIAKEAVNNAVKHSGAKNIVVSLRSGAEMLSLRVKDDGIGLPGDVASRDGMGLRIMRHRAQAIGGFLDFQHVRPRGTAVRCYVRGAGGPASPNGERFDRREK